MPRLAGSLMRPLGPRKPALTVADQRVLGRQARRQGLQFEEEVKIALEALGYQVTNDTLEIGCQVDLVAHHKGALFEHRLVVECKSSDSVVGVSEVRELSAIVDSLSTKPEPVHGMLVSKTGFTKEAKAFSAPAGLQLFTLKDLATKSFNTKPILGNVVAQFENDNLSSAYIDLSCQVSEQGRGTVYKPVERFLDDFFATTARRGVAVLGNFGSGKTSLCRHYAYLLARRWMDTNGGRQLPVFVHLRELSNLNNLEDDVLRILNRDFSADAMALGWRQWLKNGQTLLLLDGFDEMATAMDRVTIRNSLAALGRFTAQHAVKYVLSCRTHFFKTKVEEDALGDTLRLYMCDWGRAELIEYVKHSVPKNAPGIVKAIDETYNLEELARTPIFLNMIVDSVGRIQSGMSHAKLYQIYTDRWIESQAYRSRLSAEDKRHFMEELAFEMFVNDSTKISHQQLPESVRRVFGLRDFESVLAFDNDIRTCTFLVRDADGFYRFSHKSYAEFFLASRLARRIKEKRTDEFSQKEVTPEIAGFIASFFESDWVMLIRLMLGDHSEVCRANAAAVLGKLPISPQIHDAMLLGLGTEQSFKVLPRICDALATSGTDSAISELLALSVGNGELSHHCLRILSQHQARSDVSAAFRDILQSEESSERVSLALRAATAAPNAYREAVARLLRSDWWRHSEQVIRGLLELTDRVTDLGFARSFEDLLKGAFVSEALDAQRRQALQGLRLTFRSAIEERILQRSRATASHGRTEAVLTNRSSCAGAIRREFGFLVDDAHFDTTLDRAYPGSTVRIGGRSRRRGMG